MLSTTIDGIRPVLANMANPEIFFEFPNPDLERLEVGDAGLIGIDNPDVTEKKMSKLQMAFFFRGEETRDFTLVRHTLTDTATEEVQVVPTSGMIRLPVVDKKVLTEIFREVFVDRCVDFDNVSLIAEALAQNCIAQFKSEDSARLFGAFKMTINREMTPEGVTEFSLVLSALKSQFVGLEVLEKACDIELSTSTNGEKHKIEVKPKRLRRPSVSYDRDDISAEIKSVFDQGGSVMIPENGTRREVICEELLKKMKFEGVALRRLLPCLNAAIIELEQEGYAFNGKGVVAYTAAGLRPEDPHKIYLVVKPFSLTSKVDEKELKTLKLIFNAAFQKGSRLVRMDQLFKVDTFEADSYYFGAHSAVELALR